MRERYGVEDRESEEGRYRSLLRESVLPRYATLLRRTPTTPPAVQRCAATGAYGDERDGTSAQPMPAATSHQVQGGD